MRVTSQHWEAFLNAAEKNPTLITGKFNRAQGKAEGNALWLTIATKLNALGLGEKSVIEWRRAVTDWKCKVKSKASKLKLSQRQTGGGPNDAPPLSSVEERLLNLMGKKGFEGDKGIQELGMPPLQNELKRNAYVNCSRPYENVPQEIVANTLRGPHMRSIGGDHLVESSKIAFEEQPSTLEFQEPDIVASDHDYPRKRKSDLVELTPNKTNKQKTNSRKRNISTISTNIENMIADSVDILKNIEKNTARIADSFEKLVTYLVTEK